MALFDRYIIVDWSAAGSPKTRADSIWIGHHADGASALANPATRAEAEALLRRHIAEADAVGARLFMGFDFAFGYPEGAAAALTGDGDWRALWAQIAETMQDDAQNANNRFDVAAMFNRRLGGAGPFWGNGLKRDIPDLPRKKPGGYGTRLPPVKRHAEAAAKGTQETWKLSGAGAVGGQTLTGIAMLERLRQSLDLEVWPFENLGVGRKHLLAEIFPSLIEPDPNHEIKDAGQVAAMLALVARLDGTGQLAGLLEDPARMDPCVTAEEGWILGAGRADLDIATPAPKRQLRYERDPAAIYKASFATVAREARLDRFDPPMRDVVTRIVHACGMVEVADRLAFSHGAAAAGRQALLNGAPILCDCEMVRGGISSTLVQDAPLICTLNEPSVPEHAKTIANTRSAAAVELWRDHLEGAVVAIGNAPTALFHLLELIDMGWPKPAVILGFPVGFVGAAESKAELAERPRGCSFITLRGRRGGSAMAAAAVNALAAGLGEAKR